MRTFTVAEFKSRFADVLKAVQAGEEVAVSYGKRHETIGVLIPYAKYRRKTARKLGQLAGKATFRTRADFKISDDELLNS